MLFLPNMTSFIQPISAGIRWSVRIAIGNTLYKWLMDEYNSESWKSKLTTSVRSFLVNRWIIQAMRHVMSNEMEKMRIGCFERTGCLITMLTTQKHDAKIKPQGMLLKSLWGPTVRQSSNDNATSGTVDEESDIPNLKPEEETTLEKEENHQSII